MHMGNHDPLAHGKSRASSTIWTFIQNIRTKNYYFIAASCLSVIWVVRQGTIFATLWLSEKIIQQWRIIIQKGGMGQIYMGHLIQNSTEGWYGSDTKAISSDSDGPEGPDGPEWPIW